MKQYNPCIFLLLIFRQEILEQERRDRDLALRLASEDQSEVEDVVVPPLQRYECTRGLYCDGRCRWMLSVHSPCICIVIEANGRCRGLHSYVSIMECMLNVHSPCIYMYNVIQIQMEDVYKFSQMQRKDLLRTIYNCMPTH